MPQSDITSLEAAWAALTGPLGGDGWRTTDYLTIGSCRLLAARMMPDDLEAIMIGFADGHIPSAPQLPVGRGFQVEGVKGAPPGWIWIAVSRREGATLALFRTMIGDLVGMIRAARDASIPLLIGRLRAWQDFMSRGNDGRLNAEEEIGLFGEIHVLEQLLGHIPDVDAVLSAWTGPAGGLHDFVVGTGAIEVKSTTSSTGFLARIGSLAQLDPAGRSPLHLAAVRLAIHPSGSTLPERIEQLTARLPVSGSSWLFEQLLLQAGYLDAMADSYVRRLVTTDMRLLVVDHQFPALTHRSVPSAVVSALYTIDLDVAGLVQATLPEFLTTAGYGQPA